MVMVKGATGFSFNFVAKQLTARRRPFKMASPFLLLLLLGALLLPGHVTHSSLQPHNFNSEQYFVQDKANVASELRLVDVVRLPEDSILQRSRRERPDDAPDKSEHLKNVSNGTKKATQMEVKVTNPPIKIAPTSNLTELTPMTNSSLGVPPMVASNVTVWLNKTQDLNQTATTPISHGLGQTQNATLPNAEDDEDDFPPMYNDTSKKLIQEGKYYKIQYRVKGEEFWVDLDNHSESITHDMLSNAHRRAATLKLKFEFPFYGHRIKNVTLATGGFLYLGDQVHAWLAATQYIAPLMANFDSSLSQNATIRYLSNETSFTVEWTKVHLQDSQDHGPFTFQSTLLKNGTIIFAYKEIPVSVNSINDTHHPVKVGISEAYVKDRQLLYVKQKTIYEYDRIEIKDANITNGVAFIFTPFENCLDFNNCTSCATSKTKFDCVWCHAIAKCTDGTDRNRQDFITKQCEKNAVNTVDKCNSPTSTEASEYHHHDHDEESHSPRSKINHEEFPHERSESYSIKKEKLPEEGMGAGGVVGILFLVMMIFVAVGWLLYAYLYPHSPSGQFLIRHRPSQWAFRRGEARYTAASIHM